MLFQFGIYKDNDFNENNYKIVDIFLMREKLKKLKKLKEMEIFVIKIKLFIIM